MRLSRERKTAVEWWTQSIKQPKHVVLTVRNADVLTKQYVQTIKSAFSRLRRTKFARNWTGGFYSVEVTNESRGWHVHIHALVDAKWIDARELSQQWAKAVGQEFAIVKVKDARGADYLAEVTKYAVKGNDLSRWSSPDIVAFIDAFDGVRTFGVFGTLYGKRTEFREFLDQLQRLRIRCDCGCERWRIMSDQEFEWNETVSVEEANIPPPHNVTGPIHHPELFPTVSFPPH